MNASPDDYPVDAFPVVVRSAIVELGANIQAPLPMIGSAFLATMSATVQGSTKIMLPIGGEPRPVSLYVLVVAESGERKSTVDRLVAKPLYKHDEQLDAQYKEELRKYEHDYEPWSATKKAFLNQITAAIVKNLPTEEWEERLEQHRKAEPKKPKNRRLIRQDLTERALFDAMEGKGVSLVVMSDEGEIVFRSPSFQKNGVLNKAWDAGTVVFDRANGVSFSARDIRLTVSLMTQASVIREYLNRRGEMARGTGFFARFLMCFPTSTQGYRQTSILKPSWDSLDKFHRRANQLIESQVCDHFEECYSVLELDEDARVSWLNFINTIESNMKPGLYLSDINDFASKAGEIVARIAGIFHVFSGQSGKISNDTLQRAIMLVNYHVVEFKKLFSDAFKTPEWEVDANAVLRYLHRNYFSRNFCAVDRNHLYRYGPVRDRVKFAAALLVLAQRGFIWIGFVGKRKQIVNLCLEHFSQLPAMF